MEKQLTEYIERLTAGNRTLTPDQVLEVFYDCEIDDKAWETILLHLFRNDISLQKPEKEAAGSGQKANRFAAEYLESLRALPVPDEQDFLQMFLELKQGGQMPAGMTEAFLPYVAECALEWHSGYDSVIQDLVGEGCEGALYAINNPSLLEETEAAEDFRNKVNWWIGAYMFRFMYSMISAKGIANHLADRMNLVMNARGRLGGLLGHAPTAADIADDTGLEIEEVMAILRQLRTQEKNAAQQGRSLVQSRKADIDDAADHIGFEEDLEKLDIDERYILQTLYGFGGRERLTAEEAAVQLDMTPEDIRSIEKRALSKLKQIKKE